MTARTSATASLSCLVLFAFVMHWPVFLQGKTVAAFDLSYFQFIAYRANRPPDVERPSNYLFSDPVLLFNVWDKAMYEGALERPWLWNPYAACGSPLLANAQSAPFFPLKAIAYAPVGVYKGFGSFCFLKMLVAGLLMWAYMRALGAGYLARTLGGLGFMACGFMIAWLQWALTSVALTLPLLFLGCEYLVQQRLRRGFLLIGAATALALFGGHPETSFHLTVAAVVYLVGRLACSTVPSRDEKCISLKRGFACAGIFLLAVLLGATVAGVQLLPTIESIRLSALVTERSATDAAHGQAAVVSLGNLQRIHHEIMTYLVPNTWGNPSLHSHWWGKFSNYNESAAYAGIGITLLALFAWRYCARDRTIRILCLLQLLSLGFILRIPFMHQVLGRLPLFDIAENKRFLLVFCFANAAMTGLALDHLLKTRKLARTDIAWLSIIVLAFVSLVLRDYIKRFAANPHDWIRAYGRTQLAHFLIFLIPWSAVLFLSKMKASLRTAVCAVLIALLAADLYLIYFGYNPFIKPELIYPETPAIEFLQAKTLPTRVLPLDAQIGPNVPALYGLQDPRIYDAVVYAPYAEFLTRLGSKGPWNIVEEPDRRLCSIAGIRYLFARPEWTPETSEGMDLIYEDDLSKIYENRDALPLAYVSHQWREISSPKEAYDLLAEEDFPWESTVVVEADKAGEVPSVPVEEKRPHTPARIAEYQPHSVVVEIPDHSAGLLVLNDCFYPGWHAFVDGRQKPIYRVNGTFRGVFVEPQDKRVVFKYDPASYRYGLIVSIAGVVMLGAVAIPLPKGVRHKLRVKKR